MRGGDWRDALGLPPARGAYDDEAAHRAGLAVFWTVLLSCSAALVWGIAHAP